MASEAGSTGLLYIYAGGTPAPYLGDILNRYQRFAHDADHIALQAPFSWDGELAAARLASCRHPGLAWYYACEIVGQAACYFTTGQFPTQRLVRGLERYL